VIAFLFALGSTVLPAQEVAVEIDPDRFVLSLPPGPAADAWSRVQPDTQPAAAPAEWQELFAGEVWSRASNWRRWCALLARERARETSSPEGRATLARLAMEQGRSEDAWQHFAALIDAPIWTAAVLPALLIGTRLSPSAGGTPAPLESGALLRPCPPPGILDAESGRLVWCEMEVRGLRIGETRCALRVAVEADGVQVDLRPLAGPAVRLRVLLPLPLGHVRDIEYVDWDRQETLGVPHELELLPEAEKLSLWGRFLPAPLALPTLSASTRKLGLPAGLRAGGLWLVDARAQEDPLLTALAEGLRELLELDVRLLNHVPTPEESWTGTVVRIPAGEERAAFLALLCSAVEAYVLAPDLGIGGR
jgi:hypothetical protein